MLSVKDGLSEEGGFSRRAEFLKGHLPEAAAGAKHQELSWAPGWRARNTDSICRKQTGSRFLSLTVTRTQPAQNDNKKFSKSWGKENQLWLGAQVKRAWGPTCYVLSSVKSFCKLWGLLSCTSHYNTSFLKNQMPVGGNPVSYLFLWVAVDRALLCCSRVRQHLRPNTIPHVRAGAAEHSRVTTASTDLAGEILQRIHPA